LLCRLTRLRRNATTIGVRAKMARCRSCLSAHRLALTRACGAARAFLGDARRLGVAADPEYVASNDTERGRRTTANPAWREAASEAE
jgi:hypothetical protein